MAREAFLLALEFLATDNGHESGKKLEEFIVQLKKEALDDPKTFFFEAFHQIPKLKIDPPTAIACIMTGMALSMYCGEDREDAEKELALIRDLFNKQKQAQLEQALKQAKELVEGALKKAGQNLH